jgi:hypothetical protein
MHSPSDTAAGPALAPSVSEAALWNPAAAACWSLVFTPAFGSYLVMRNWETLGQPRQAAVARKWFVFSLGLLVVQVLSAAFDARLHSESNLIDWVRLSCLVGWWVASAVPQARLLRSRFGAAYPRKQWDHALLGAVLAGTAYFVAKAFFTFLFVALT